MLIKFLLKDKIGIRKSLILLFLQTKSCNTVEIYDYLIKQGFNVKYRVVSAIVVVLLTLIIIGYQKKEGGLKRGL